MAIIISRENQPALFSDEEKPISDVVNAVEAIYAEIGTQAGYNQQELIKACKEQGLSTYEINTSLSILFQLKKILSIIE